MNKYLMIFVVAFLMVGCHGHKKSDTGSSTIDTAQAIDADTAYMMLAEYCQPWSDVYMSVNLSLLAPSKMSISGRATMVRDDNVHMSLRMLGMEVAVLHISSDSIWAIDKFHKYYVAESMRDLLGGYDFNINDLQDLLLGQPIAPDRVPQGLDWWYNVAETDPPLLAGIVFMVPDKAQVALGYDDQYDTPAGIIASTVDIDAQAVAQTVAGRIQWGIEGAKWNTSRFDALKKPGADYKRLDVKALLKSMGTPADA